MTTTTSAVAVDEWEHRNLDAHTPLELSDVGVGWLITSGEVDVFAVPSDPGGGDGRRVFLGSLHTGDLLLGGHTQAAGAPDERNAEVGPIVPWRLVAVGVSAEVAALPADWALQVTKAPEFELGFAGWLNGLLGGWSIAGAVQSAPQHPGDEPTTVTAGTVLNSRWGLRWFAPDDAQVTVGDRLAPPGSAVPLAVPPVVSVQASGSGVFRDGTQVSPELAAAGVRWFQQAVISHVVSHARDTIMLADTRHRDRAALEQSARDKALGEFQSIGESTGALVTGETESVLAACTLLGAAQGITVVAGPSWSAGNSLDPVRAIARASGARVRAVTLSDGWWRNGVDPMMAFLIPDGDPVVVLPRKKGGFDLVHPLTGARRRVTSEVAKTLRPSGYVMYRPMPTGAIGVRELLSFGLRGTSQDLRRTVLFSLIAGVLSLAIPVASGIILGTLVPEGETSVIIAAAVVLFLVVFANTSFMLARSGRLLRLQGRMLSSMQSGLWDRLIALPVSFFNRYSVADLTQRVTGVSAIQQIVSSVASQTMLSLVTLVFSLALLVVYNSQVAMWVIGITAVVVAISATLTWAQITRLRAMYDAKGAASGVMLQLIQGIDKIRASAAENRALAAWSAKFAVQAELLLTSERLSAVRTAIYAALPVLLTLTVFTIVGNNPDVMSTAAFLTFIAALGQVTSSTTQLDLSLGYVLNIVPMFDRVRPVLEEPVEIVEGATDPGLLRGHVALTNVSYRYPGMSALVLDEITMSAEPGEFLAIVGPSGSGKSTIVRLLLGFDRPETGSVTYDSQDLVTLDARAVRAQIGVSMQNAAVSGSDILSAIVGDWPLTEQDAWAAAEKVGLADDIKKLPMGMRTILGENAGTFSGGQRQRLVLAAAIARNPRIVILDEATSALDSVTQAHVADSFARLQVTRIVVAHRLSTIRGADRIVVLEHGRIVQTGTYEELVGQPGVFAQMVSRQTL